MLQLTGAHKATNSLPPGVVRSRGQAVHRDILLDFPMRLLGSPQTLDCPLRVPSNTPDSVAFLSADSNSAQGNMGRRRRFYDEIARVTMSQNSFACTLPCPKTKPLAVHLASSPPGRWKRISLHSSCVDYHQQIQTVPLSAAVQSSGLRIYCVSHAPWERYPRNFTSPLSPKLD